MGGGEEVGASCISGGRVFSPANNVSRFGVTPLVSSLRECCDSFLQTLNFFGKAPSGVGEEGDKLPVLSSSLLSLCSNCFANPHRLFPSSFPRLLRGPWCGLEALITGFPPLEKQLFSLGE